MKHLLLQLVLLLALSACNTSKQIEKESTILSVIHGTSFGHCRGYCTNEITFTPLSTILTSKSVDEKTNPPKVKDLKITKDEWNSIFNAIDLEKFFQLDERYGCPDCADGGSEYIEIKTINGTKRVTIEFGSEGEMLGKLLPVLRQLRKEKIVIE